MTDPTAANTSQKRRTELRTCASQMIKHLRAEVLPVPGRRATVRAALGQQPGSPRTFRAYREINTFLPTPVVPWQERAFFEVAALVCAQPATNRQQEIATTEPGDEDTDDSAPRDHRSLGHSCAQAVNQGRVKESSMEARLHQICRVDAEGVYRLLPRLIHHLRGVGVDIDWVSLIDDLAGWDVARNHIAARWLRGFYSGLTSQTPTHNPTVDDTSQEDQS